MNAFQDLDEWIWMENVFCALRTVHVRAQKARMSLEFAGNPQERSLTEKSTLKSWEMMLDSCSGVRFLRALNWIPGWGISVLSHTGGGDIQLYELAWSKWGFSKMYLSLVCKGCLKWEVRSSREIGDICPNSPKWLGPRLQVGPVVTGNDQVYSHAQLLLNLFIFFSFSAYILSTFYGPSSILGTRDTATIK